MDPAELERRREIKRRAEIDWQNLRHKEAMEEAALHKKLERKYQWGMFKEAVRFLIPAVLMMLLIYVLTAMLMFQLSHCDMTQTQVMFHWKEALLWQW